tara:strand:+ start:15725 stop:15889 length:165 start_codon:yes stop_codon:yes gene_type:complete
MRAPLLTGLLPQYGNPYDEKYGALARLLFLRHRYPHTTAINLGGCLFHHHRKML